jgi:DNA-binding NarL/FixJ family response regulator
MTITIFLVDDHLVVLEGLRLILSQQEDFEIVGQATDGIEAVRRLLRIQPDVAIVDISMPALDGIGVTERVLARCSSIRVIILSMQANPSYVQRALASGADGYLLKGSASRHLVQAIRTVCAGQRYLTPKVAEMVSNGNSSESSRITD